MEKKYIAISVIVICLIAYRYYRIDDATFTLYRNSLLLHGETMRFHVATFDSHSSLWTSSSDSYESYNKENCDLAASLFQQQPDVKTKFWCEKGRYRE